MSWLPDPFSGKDQLGALIGLPGATNIMGQLGIPTNGFTDTNAGLTPWKTWGGIKKDYEAFKHRFMPDTRQDRQIIANSSTTPRRIVYGKTRVSGQLVFAETTEDTKVLNLVVVLAGHPCTLATRTEGAGEKDDIYLDEKKIEDLVTQGICEYRFYDGTQTTADSQLVTDCPSWTSDHILTGCTYIILKLTFAENAWPSGIPTPKVVIKGYEVYDPRTSTTSWSDNPALCIRHYMLLSTIYGGMGCSNSEIDENNIITAADICDELVAKDQVGGTEKRYTCNGTTTLDQTPSNILQRMISSMSGRCNYSSGTWKIYAGAYSTPRTEPIDESYLNGAVKVNIGANKNTLLNTVKGSFVDPDNLWAVTDFPTVTIPDYVTADGEELSGSLQLDFTISSPTAQRLAKIDLERSRRGTTVEYPCNLKAYDIGYNDVVKITNSQLGWDEREFRVIGWEGGATGGVNLTLQEEDPAIYTWVAGDINPLIAPAATTLLDPWAPFGRFNGSAYTDGAVVSAVGEDNLTVGTSSPLIQSVSVKVLDGHKVTINGSFVFENAESTDWYVMYRLYRDTTSVLNFTFGNAFLIKQGTKVVVPFQAFDVPDVSGDVTYYLRVPFAIHENTFIYSKIALSASSGAI